MFTDECIQQVLATQQQNLQRGNDANFSVDYQNCVAGGNAPGVCAGRTYGLTPAGGYTSNWGPGGQSYQDAHGNTVGGAPAPVYVPVVSTPLAPVPVTPVAPAVAPAAAGYVNSAASFLGDSLSVAGYSIPYWGLAAAGLVAGMLFLKGGR